MKTRLFASPWLRTQKTLETAEALEILKNDVWKEASVLFAAEREAKIKSGKYEDINYFTDVVGVKNPFEDYLQAGVLIFNIKEFSLPSIESPSSILKIEVIAASF